MNWNNRVGTRGNENAALDLFGNSHLIGCQIILQYFAIFCCPVTCLYSKRNKLALI